MRLWGRLFGRELCRCCGSKVPRGPTKCWQCGVWTGGAHGTAKPGQWKKKPGFWKRLFSRGSDVKKRVPSGLADEIRKCVSDGGGDRDRLTKLIERCKAYDDGLSTLSEARRVCNRRWHALAKDLDDAIKAWQPPTVPTAERPSPTPTTTAPQSPRNASSQQRWFAAVESGDVEEVKSLIAAGTNVNMKNDDGRTALHLAVLEGTYAAAPLVSALLVGGADKDARQKEGWTPLHLAVANYRIAAVSALLAFKAQTEVWDEVGNTPLHMAAHEDHGLIVKALLAAGADKNVRTTGVGATPLHFAAFYCHPTIAEILLAAGADKHAKNKYGRTALDLAKEELGKFASQRSSGGYSSIYSDAAREKRCTVVVELLCEE